LKLNGTHQLLVYVADISTLFGSIHTVRKNNEPLLVSTSSKETSLEVNANKTKYMVLSRAQHAGKITK